MRLPTLQGLIKRRILVNFRVDAAVMQRLLPSPFRPKLQAGYAMAGICLIRLEHIRPSGIPAPFGIASENAAHRIAVMWQDEAGVQREGVFIPRRDTGSRLNHLAGGRLFPGEHHLASFSVADDGQQVDFAMQSHDGCADVRLRGHTADALPDKSCFTSLSDASQFFEGGCVGYSVTREALRLDGIRLQVQSWQVRPFNVTDVETRFFADTSLFPASAVQFDHALIMRDIAHEWYQEPDMITGPVEDEAYEAVERSHM